MTDRKSIIPEWCGNSARWLMQNFGFDDAVLEGAIAAALHTERERCANYVLRRPGDIQNRQEIADALRAGHHLKADGTLVKGDA